jgi:hypothetical protein
MVFSFDRTPIKTFICYPKEGYSFVDAVKESNSMAKEDLSMEYERIVNLLNSLYNEDEEVNKEVNKEEEASSTEASLIGGKDAVVVGEEASDVVNIGDVNREDATKIPKGLYQTSVSNDVLVGSTVNIDRVVD